MRITDLIGLIGSIVTIGSAIWAGISVGIIKKTKSEIFSKLKIVKYSELTYSSKGVIAQLRKIVNKDKIPPGFNFQGLMDILNDYYEHMNKIKYDIHEDGYSDFENHMKEMKNNLNVASKTDRKNPKGVIDIFTKIYYHVLEIDSSISKYNKMIIENCRVGKGEFHP